MGNNKNKRLSAAQRRDLVAEKAEQRLHRQEDEIERYSFSSAISSLPLHIQFILAFHGLCHVSKYSIVLMVTIQLKKVTLLYAHLV